MDTHRILSDKNYNRRSDYTDIARRAAQLACDGATEAQVLKTIAQEFGEPPRIEAMLKSPLSYEIYGQVGIDFQFGAIKQMNTAMQLPVSVAGALMPDAHPGYAMPIGGVVALDHAVSPSFVGYDIACRMTLSILEITPTEFLARREGFAANMLAVSSFGKGANFEGAARRSHPVMDDPLWNQLHHLKQLKSLAWTQLGSSGGGNHFFDAVIGKVTGEADWLPLSVGAKFVAIITHSGSRGVGHKMATRYVKLAAKETRAITKGVPSGYEWLGTDTDAGREYLQVMELMGRYAQANHHLIHDLFLEQSGLAQVSRYENHHNFAWVNADGSVTHRKGATPAGKGVVGIIPGSSGTSSYLVEGLGNPASLESSSHGAGRPFSRTEAKRNYDAAFVNQWMTEQDILHFGLAPDEALTAYKDIDHVMDLQAELVRPVASMMPTVVIMGGSGGRD